MEPLLQHHHQKKSSFHITSSTSADSAIHHRQTSIIFYSIPANMICSSCRAAMRMRSVCAPSLTAARSISSSASRSLPSFQLRRAQRHETIPIKSLLNSTARFYSTNGETAATEEPTGTQAEQDITALLQSKLSPTALLVQDISGGCGSMYAIDITSPMFKGQTILKQQRMVNAALGDVMKQWHGVQIRTSVPQ